ncbi:hypothetical protein [Halomonas sp. BN3-1]|uniref:hypothetical protein n=1 Tax=Halomonas sp. BN3-1 TaxID=2082393 RepID=UPI000D39CCD8|nr:hypothetical protein [Halomonas sp. BN3-1]
MAVLPGQPLEPVVLSPGADQEARPEGQGKQAKESKPDHKAGPERLKYTAEPGCLGSIIDDDTSWWTPVTATSDDYQNHKRPGQGMPPV